MKDLNVKPFVTFIGMVCCYLLLAASPNARADLVTAYTFEPGTELIDVAEC